MDRWTRAQAIGITSYLLITQPVVTVEGSAEAFNKAQELLHQYIVQDAGIDKYRRRVFFESLAPSVLVLLLRATARKTRIGTELHEVTPEIKKSLETLCEGKNPPINRAQIWAYHALIGRADTRKLLRLGDKLKLGKEWRSIEENLELFENIASQIQVLRNSWVETGSKLSAVSILTDLFGPSSNYWPQIENILYQNIFSWPLLAIAGENRTNGEIGVSLPVSVDVSISNKRKLFGCEGLKGKLSLNEWSSHLERSQRIARELWRAKHGNYGDFREVIKRAHVQFDFSVAQQVTADLEGSYKITLTDGSADVYFTQVVLNKLLARPGLLGSTVTGLLGKQMTRKDDDEPLLNYEFDAPGGIGNKLGYVFGCHTFERVVLPRGTEAEVTNFLEKSVAVNESTFPVDEKTGGQTAEVVFAGEIQTVADIVQMGGWRQHQYIRCPELLWAIHSDRKDRPGLIDANNHEVRSIIEKLATNPSPVMTLDVRPLVLASALWHINTILRNQISPSTPPGLSWTFIRTLKWEQDSRFWQVIFRATGANEDDYHHFLKYPSREHAANNLAKVLNKFEPDLESPSHRAPDIIVIVGSKLFETSQSESFNALSRPFMVSPLLERLSSMLVSVYDSRLLTLVGNTRIVLIPEVDVAKGEPLKLPKISAWEKRVLGTLAIFDGAFTQQTAALALSRMNVNIKGRDLRGMLRALDQKGALRYGQGKYHLPSEVKSALAMSLNPDDLAERYYAAGCAMVPFVSGTELPSLALDVAFEPQNIHDAQALLTLGFRQGQEVNNRRITNACRLALDFLALFTEPPSWGVVDKLIQSGSLSYEAYEMATDLLKWADAAGIPNHPRHLSYAAQAAAKCAAAPRSDSDPESHKDKTGKHFEQALINCAAFPSEKEYNTLSILTEYACYLAKAEPGQVNKFNELVKRAQDMLDAGAIEIAVWGDWFELIADREDDHGKAWITYSRGISAKPKWAQLWIKGLGAGYLTGSNERSRAEVLKATITEEQVLRLLSKSIRAFQKFQRDARKSEHVSQRWEEGLRQLQYSWGSDKKISLLLRQFGLNQRTTVSIH